MPPRRSQKPNLNTVNICPQNNPGIIDFSNKHCKSLYIYIQSNHAITSCMCLCLQDNYCVQSCNHNNKTLFRPCSCRCLIRIFIYLSCFSILLHLRGSHVITPCLLSTLSLYNHNVLHSLLVPITPHLSLINKVTQHNKSAFIFHLSPIFINFPSHIHICHVIFHPILYCIMLSLIHLSCYSEAIFMLHFCHSFVHFSSYAINSCCLIIKLLVQ